MIEKDIVKYLSGKCSDNEKREFENLLYSNSENMKAFEEYKLIWEASAPQDYEPNIEKALGEISAKLPDQLPPQKNFSFYLFRIAAVLVLGIGLFGILRLSPKMVVVSLQLEEPPRDITLNDGSVVTLNSGSTIQFPKKFTKAERRVLFEGEGFFKIAKDKSKPFVIESGNAITKVLGTQFNLVATHTDSLVRVTVAEGLVSFSMKKDELFKEVLVKAGEVGEIDVKKGVITQKANDEPNFLAWKNGVLNFDGKCFDEAVKEISSFYDRCLVVSDSGLNLELFHASFDSLPFEEVLSSIELIMDVEIEETQDTVYIREKL